MRPAMQLFKSYNLLLKFVQKANYVSYILHERDNSCGKEIAGPIDHIDLSEDTHPVRICCHLPGMIE